tara:strand:- start:2404 stop:2955 length:552 start_codon:yes stop_codon:yes gene_type:complete
MSSEQIFTSNFARAGNADGAIAICRKPPYWYSGAVNKDFAPSAKMLKEVRAGGSWSEFTANYVDILKTNDAVSWVRELLLSDLAPIYLLCFEGANVPDSCHRQTFAAYVNDVSGISIPEFQGNLTTRSRQSGRSEVKQPIKVGDVITDTTGKKWVLKADGELVQQTELFDIDDFVIGQHDSNH